MEKQNFTKLTESSGLFSNDKDSATPYYLITYKKNNTICQINFIFECWDKKCVLDSLRFGCANFDLEKDYQIQKQYYQLLSTDDTQNLYSNHKIAIVSAYKNPSGNILIQSGSWTDGSPTYFDKQNNQLCDGNICCDGSSNEIPNSYGDWCTNDYKILETYKPIGL